MFAFWKKKKKKRNKDKPTRLLKDLLPFHGGSEQSQSVQSDAVHDRVRVESHLKDFVLEGRVGFTNLLRAVHDGQVSKELHQPWRGTDRCCKRLLCVTVYSLT